MAMSLDVDAYTRRDPPHVATLPAGWQERLVRIELEAGLAAWFLEPIRCLPLR